MTFDPRHRSALDQHLDVAARSVEDHVADYVTPAFDATVRPRRSGAAVATGVAVVLLLIVAVVAATGGDPADDLVAGEIEPTSNFDEIGQAVGGPRDGLDSLRLPIEVTPSEGLADGQVVTVTGSQFPPNTQLGVVMCAQFPDRAPAGSGNCQLSPFTSVTSDADGNFQAEHPVDRVFRISTGELVDCAEIAGQCLVAVGAISDYDQSGVAPVSFDPDIPALPDPYVTIDAEGPYVDGQVVIVTVHDAQPGSQWWASQCADDGFSTGLCADVDLKAIADGDGRATFHVTVRRVQEGGGLSVDCASPKAWCSIGVNGMQSFSWSFELHFVGGATDTTEPAVPSIDAERSTSNLPETTDTTVHSVNPIPSDPTTTTTAGTTSG